jgi:hypothetical protein
VTIREVRNRQGSVSSSQERDELDKVCGREPITKGFECGGTELRTSTDFQRLHFFLN